MIIDRRIQHILCPVDASEPSVHACLQAVGFARSSKARITALHVKEPSAASGPELLWTAAGHECDDPDQAIRDWIDLQFAPARQVGVRVDQVVTTGPAAREILRYAAQASVDLIVIGTHGISGLEHLALGSVAEKVLRRAECPVLTVPPRSAAISRLPFAKVVCALDFSDCSLAALEFAMTAALGSGAALTLAHVLEWPWHEPPPPAFEELPPTEARALASYRQRRESEALSQLKALRPEGLQGRCHARISHGRPYVEILRIAEEERADLVVLGVHGRGLVDMALFGSTTNQIVRHAACPVLTLRR